MAKIDKMLEIMSSRGVERALLVADRTIELYSSEGTIDGPHLTTAQLREALMEIIPPSFFSAFQNGTSFQFVHQAPSGTFNILIQNYVTSLQATVTPLKTDNVTSQGLSSQVPSPPPVAPSPWNAPAPATPHSYNPPQPTSPYSQSTAPPVQPPPQSLAPYPQTPVTPPPPPYGAPSHPYAQSSQGYAPPPLPPYSQPGPTYAPPPPPNYPQSGYPNPNYPNQGYPNQGYPNQSYPVQGYGAPVMLSPHSKIVGGLLGIFLGCFGVHRFYLGYSGIGVIYLIAMFVLPWFTCGVSAGVAGLAGLIEGIIILMGGMKDSEGRELSP